MRLSEARICVHLWAHFLLAKARGRIEQEAAEQTETLVNTPVLVWFHPGGFQDGDKSQLEKNRRSMLQTYRNAGYAVVSCNYPFLSDDIDHFEIARHCARAMQFVRSKAKDWNIDSERL